MSQYKARGVLLPGERMPRLSLTVGIRELERTGSSEKRRLL